jgi:phosphoenolpyruvate carboxykinase (ATP)
MSGGPDQTCPSPSWAHSTLHAFTNPSHLQAADMTNFAFLGEGTTIHRNLSPSTLYEHALINEAGTTISSTGALAAYSGDKTGRCPKDKRVVLHPDSKANVWWGKGSPNKPLSGASFAKNKAIAQDFLKSKSDIYVQDGFVNWGSEVNTRYCRFIYDSRIRCALAIEPGEF